MKVVGTVVAAYLAAAVATRLAERAGLLRCYCSSDCWCHNRALSTFRWVAPIGHRSTTSDAHGGSPEGSLHSAAAPLSADS